MNSLILKLYGKPKGWDRSGQNGKFHYDTKKNTEMKAAIRILAQNEAEKQNVQLPIPSGMYGYSIKISAFFAPPKSVTKKRLAYMKRGVDRYKSKPDIDNIAKLWLDALVKGGIIEDDKNVAFMTVGKFFSGTEYTICEIGWLPDSEVENG